MIKCTPHKCYHINLGWNYFFPKNLHIFFKKNAKLRFLKIKKSTVIIAYMYLEPEYGNSKRIPNWLFLLPPLLENINKVLCVKYLTRLTAGHLPWSWQIHSSWVLSTALGMWLMPQHRHLWSQILKKEKMICFGFNKKIR